MPERRFWLVVLALLGAMGFAMLASSLTDSQTWDEANYLASGYSYIKTGDYRLNPEHPPLAKILCALPLLALKPSLNQEHPGWVNAKGTMFGREFLYRNRVPAMKLLTVGRSATMVLTLLFGLVIAVWSRRRFGAVTALFALALFCFEPVLVAHGKYATNDLLVSFGIFLACIAWGEFLLERTFRNLMLAGFCFGLALASKFSSFAFVPMAILLYLFRWWQERGGAPAESAAKQKTLGLRNLAVSLTLASLIACAVLWSTYRFELRKPMDDPFTAKHLVKTTEEVKASTDLPTETSRLIDPATRSGRLLHWVARNVPVPFYSFFKGLNRQIEHDRAGHETYLLGATSQQGWWYYFPVAFAVKTSLALLLLLAVATAASAHGLFRPGFLDRLRALSFQWYMIALPPACYFFISLFVNINIGIRYVLPVYPFLMVFAGAVLFATDRGRFARVFRVLACCLLVLLLVESLSIYPEYLAFFNVAAGGPDAGPRYLLDSNIDWGQDLARLGKYLEIHRDRCFYYEYADLGQTDPAYYGVPHRFLPESASSVNRDCLVAISVNAFYLRPERYGWLQKTRPVAKAGHSIYIYDFRQSDVP